MSNMDRIIREEARLIILRELAAQPNYSLNESLLSSTLETFGIVRPRAWVRDEMVWLAQMGAVINTEVGSVMIAQLTLKGKDHVEGRYPIEGVKRPSPRA
ncbi:MAG: hypothetical protein AB7U62_09365 [Pseudolabrys sp.]